MTTQTVLVVGSWHLGSVIGACLSDAGNKVYLWDQSPRVAEKWKKGHPPIHEPGLEELVKKHWGQNLFWADQLKDISTKADWIVLAYDTPINDQDEVQLQSVEEGFDAVLNAGISNQVQFFFTAQLPVGTSRRLRSKVESQFSSWNGHVIYQPENLRLGEAIKSFKSPDRAVLGLDITTEPNKTSLVENFQKLTGNFTTPLNIMSLESAEMVKHALNSFLATCVVFANEISELCENAGADAWDVVASLKQDSRVGPKAFLRPGLGFAGGTLARDVKTLSQFSAKKEGTNFFSQLYKLNTHRNDWVVGQLTENLGDLKNKKIVLLGVTYKPFTSTVRRSPALEIGQLLALAGSKCEALDPMADLQELSEKEIKALPYHLEKDAALAFKNADAVVLVTEWPQFKELDWPKLSSLMKQHILIDTKNHLSHKIVGEKFKYIVPGKPILIEKSSTPGASIESSKVHP